MLYVLIGLVVVLALICGAEYATLRVVRAERRAEVAELKEANHILTDKCGYLHRENRELAGRLASLDSIKEGLN